MPTVLLSKVHRLLTIALLLPALLLVSAKKAPVILSLEAVLGPRPPLRELTKDESRKFARLIKAGYLAEAPKMVRDEQSVASRKLTPELKEALLKEIGNPFEQLSSPVGATTKSGPDIPRELRRTTQGEVGRVICVFEVLPDGSVGRVASPQCTNEAFFVECAKALTRWEFEPAPGPRYFRILFSAINETPQAILDSFR